jgi:uncharacterized protein (TIRG00374 family)
VKIGRALIGFGAITVFYLAALIWIDSRNQVFNELPKLLSILPALAALSLLSYLLRYLRWHWLLRRAGNNTSVVSGFLAYVAGFAFTATPGKVGELLRIRYFVPQGVPPWRVIAAFVYERAFDLIAVLLLSALVIRRIDIFVFALGFVAIFLAGIIFAALKPDVLSKAAAYLWSWRLRKFARICMALRDGLSGCREWTTPLDLLVSLGLGMLAWGITSLSFVWLLDHLGVSIPVLSALAIYPLSMLAGAASMLPGGVGSTEAAIVALLSTFEIPLGTAMLAAIGIRLSSLWFAMFCGFSALGMLEFFLHRANVGRLPKSTIDSVKQPSGKS